MPFNKKDHHNFGEIRPRFKLRSPLSQDEIMDRLVNNTALDKTVNTKLVLGQFFIDMPIQERHFWSPELKVTLEDDEYNEYDGDTLIRVMVGPVYTVWVLFVFIYSFLGLLCLIGGMYGLSNLTLGIDSAWIWCFPITFLLIVGVWVIAKSGQKAARDETLHLVSTLYHAIGEGNAERIHI